MEHSGTQWNTVEHSGTQWNTVEQQDFHIASKGDCNAGHMKGMLQEGIPYCDSVLYEALIPFIQFLDSSFCELQVLTCELVPDHLHVLKSSQVILIHQLLVSDREPTAVHTKTHSNKCSFMQLSKPRHLRGDDISQIALQKHRCTSSNSHQSHQSHQTKLPGASAGAGVKRNKRSKSSRSTLTTSHNMNCIT